MSAKSDQIKGKAKQAVADLTGNKELHREGKRDETAGKIKEHVDSNVDKIKLETEKVKEIFDH